MLNVPTSPCLGNLWNRGGYQYRSRCGEYLGLLGLHSTTKLDTMEDCNQRTSPCVREAHPGLALLRSNTNFIVELMRRLRYSDRYEGHHALCSRYRVLLAIDPRGGSRIVGKISMKRSERSCWKAVQEPGTRSRSRTEANRKTSSH